MARNETAAPGQIDAGSLYTLSEIKRRLGIREGENTPDGKFFLGALRCVGACSLAPVVMVNDRVYGKVTADKVTEILADCVDKNNPLPEEVSHVDQLN